MKKKKKYTSGLKMKKVVLEALQERKTIQELERKYGLHPNQISTWKSQFLSSVSTVFEKGAKKR